jgi:raffinose/stachyose/melibiose transport system substrate-binding protein
VDQRTLTRRRLLQALTLGGLGAAAACAAPGASEGTGGQTQAVEAIPTGPVEGEVSFAHWRAEDKAIFDELIAAFTEANPDVTVTQDISPSNDYQTNALQRLRSGTIGDVFVAFRGAQFVDMNSAGLYVPLAGQQLIANYDSALIDAGRHLGSQIGLPYQVVFNMPVANMDAVDATGVTVPPPDWDGFLALCEALKSQGLVPMAWPGGDVGNAGHLLNAMVMNNAPSDDMFTKIEDGTYKTTDDWFIKTLDQYAQLRPYFQDNATGTAVEPAQQLFAEGRAGMLVTGSFHMAAVRKLGATFPMDLVPPITVPTEEVRNEGIYNATFILGVNSASDVQPAALAFIEFLSQPENASIYANGTGQHVSVAGATYENEDLKATEPWLTASTLLAPRFQFLDLDIRNAVEIAAVQVVGGTGPEQAAQEAQSIIDQRVEQTPDPSGD